MTIQQYSTNNFSMARRILIGIFLYYFLSGVWLFLDPNRIFEWTDMPVPNYPWLVQIAGLFTALFGFIFLVAARSPKVFVEFVYIGLAAQIIYPLFTLLLYSRRDIPASAALPMIFADVTWVVLLILAIRQAKRNS